MAVPARAQFYSDGCEPARLKWYSMDTEHYRFIFPEGLDSLTRVYGRLMEQYRPAIGTSTGFVPGSMYRSKTKVVLHAYSNISNGSVAWAPKRMEFHTLPESDGPWPMPWEKSLAIHESRHLAQMQAGYAGWLWKPVSWLIGEMGPGAFAGVYPGLHMLEGDAVTAETALSATGRGRTASFLGFYMSAFDRGDWRDWHKWRWGSWKHYSPNHYALGYMTVAGARAFYDDPLFMQRYFTSAASHPLRTGHLRRTLLDDTGQMSLRRSGRVIMEQFYNQWLAETEKRGPFSGATLVTPEEKWYIEYHGGVSDGENIYIKRFGKAEATSLVKISPDGTQERLCTFARSTSPLALEGGRLWWSETVSDLRWEQAGTSRIRFMDLSDMKKHDFTTEGRLFNPDISPDGSKVAAVDFPLEGGSAVVVLASGDGSPLERIQAPDTLQFAQAIWVGDDMLAVSTVSEGGSSIYTLSGGRLRRIVGPQPVTIGRMTAYDGRIVFHSDHNGSDEIYSVDPESLRIYQKTSTRYGASDPFYVGDSLLYTTHTVDGRLLWLADGAFRRERHWQDIHHYPVADKLSAQEQELGLALADPDTVSFSQPKRYRKFPQIFNFHSWVLPLYVDPDVINEVSFDVNDYIGKLGATLMFQDVLGTAVGSVGYSWGSASDGEGLRHAGHFKLTYSGLFPVFELSAHVGERTAYQYRRMTYTAEDFIQRGVDYTLRNKPSFNASLRTYIPFNFSSGGWSRGLVPSLSYIVSNDLYDKSDLLFTIDGAFGSKSKARLLGYEESSNVPMQVLTASLRGYAFTGQASATEFPRWGAGFEAGWHGRVGMTEMYSSALYAYLYGYLPGFTRTQGLKLTAMYQHLFDNYAVFREHSVNTVPRGLAETSVALSMLSYGDYATNQLRLTADYSIPLWFGDISWFSPVTYITHFVLKPHADVSFFPLDREFDGVLGSLGASFVTKLAHLAWVPASAEIGFSFDWNYGNALDRFVDEGVLKDQNRLFIGLVFNTSL